MFLEPVSTKPAAVERASVFPNIDAAVAKLIERLKETHPHLTSDQILLRSFCPILWNDASLGCPEEGYCYAQVLTPGYVLEFQVGDDYFPVHTNANGTQIAIPSKGENN